MKCATCTLKPIEVAEVRLPKSHVDDSTSPHAAAASTPIRPTIAWSMKNIITLVICANIEGILNKYIKLSFSAFVIASPLRILPSSMSLFFFANISSATNVPNNATKVVNSFWFLVFSFWFFGF